MEGVGVDGAGARVGLPRLRHDDRSLRVGLERVVGLSVQIQRYSFDT